MADPARRIVEEAGHQQPRRDAARPRLGGDPLALRPLADDDQPRRLVGHGGEGADQPRQVLDRAQPGDGADHDLARPALEARDRALLGRPGEARDRDAVRDPHRHLPPGLARDPLEPLGRHDQP